MKEKIPQFTPDELKKQGERAISDGKLVGEGGNYVSDRGVEEPRLEVSAGGYVKARGEMIRHRKEGVRGQWAEDFIREIGLGDTIYHGRDQDFWEDQTFWRNNGFMDGSENRVKIPLNLKGTGIELTIAFTGHPHYFEIAKPYNVYYGLDELNKEEINEFDKKLKKLYANWKKQRADKEAA